MWRHKIARTGTKLIHQKCAAGPKGLYLATGHGTLGWTMAAGTGRVMADLISGRTPAIDMAGLTVDRYPNAYA